jgi:small subunit ribosomal protein S4
MARYIDSVCRQCRRESMKLFLKGDRCFGVKCAITKRPNPPGMHGVSRKKPSQYGVQLREKQKARHMYGLMESQFRKTFEKAARMRGITGENLLVLLERRLDNVVYRLGIGESRPQSRQLVGHGHILVNGKKVDIPSFVVKPGDVITIKERSQSIDHIKSLREEGNRNLPKWLSLDADKLKATILALPQRDDIDLTIEEHQIVELYSR